MEIRLSNVKYKLHQNLNLTSRAFTRSIVHQCIIDSCITLFPADGISITGYKIQTPLVFHAEFRHIGYKCIIMFKHKICPIIDFYQIRPGLIWNKSKALSPTIILVRHIISTLFNKIGPRSMINQWSLQKYFVLLKMESYQLTLFLSN